jgi:hypothetical protein
VHCNHIKRCCNCYCNAATILTEKFQTFCFVAQHHANIEQETTLSVVIQGNRVDEDYFEDSGDLEEGEISPCCVESTYQHSPKSKFSSMPCTNVEEGEIMHSSFPSSTMIVTLM